MENQEGKVVDLYVPRKCAATNRLIKAHDHASVQLNICDVDEQGKMLPTHTTFALCGFVRYCISDVRKKEIDDSREKGEGDDCINKLATDAGLLKNVWTYAR